MAQDIELHELQKVVMTMRQELDELKTTLADQQLSDEDQLFHAATRRAWKEVDQGNTTMQSYDELLEDMTR